MKYIKYLVLIIFITIFNCSVKKPVENIKEEFPVGPGEKVSLFKDRGLYAELYFQNETQSELTLYIEALGDVWGYDTLRIQHPNIEDSLSESSITVGNTTEIDTGFDHVAMYSTPTGGGYDGPPFGYSVYKIGIQGTNKWMKISWLDDRYDRLGQDYPSHDIYAVYNGQLKIKYSNPNPPPSWIEEVSENSVYHIWNTLLDDDETSVEKFEGDEMNEITDLSISGTDSLGTGQSGNFTAKRTSNGKRYQFLEYKWEVKKVIRFIVI